MADSLVLSERDGAVAVVLLNRPEQLNALSEELMEELVTALQELDGDEAVRAIVLGGNERAFAAGADIGELDAKVDAVVENLERKLPQTTRYAKQHLNFWKDFAWHQTINHARDWLALSMATDEPRAAIEKFLERK